jgi:hypothetical protein
MKQNGRVIKWFIASVITGVLCGCSYYGEVSPASYHGATRPLVVPPPVTMDKSDPEYPMPAPVAHHAPASEIPPELGN